MAVTNEEKRESEIENSLQKMDLDLDRTINAPRIK